MVTSAQVEGQCLTERHFYDVIGPGVELHLTHQSGTSSSPLFCSGGLKRSTALLLHSRLTATELGILLEFYWWMETTNTEGQMIDNYSIPIFIHKAGIYIFQTLAGRQMTESHRHMFKSRIRVNWKVQFLK